MFLRGLLCWGFHVSLSQHISEKLFVSRFPNSPCLPGPFQMLLESMGNLPVVLPEAPLAASGDLYVFVDNSNMCVSLSATDALLRCFFLRQA